MRKILNDDLNFIIQDLKNKNYQRPQIKNFLLKQSLVDKISLPTISRALAHNKKVKKVNQ